MTSFLMILVTPFWQGSGSGDLDLASVVNSHPGGCGVEMNTCYLGGGDLYIYVDLYIYT